VENFLARSSGALIERRCDQGQKPRCRFQVHGRV
jgi:hypothetical protein